MASPKKTIDSVSKKFKEIRKGKSVKVLPEKSRTSAEIIKQVQNLNKDCRKNWTDGGRASGTVYTADESHWEFIAEVMKHCIVSNPLHIDEFMYVT